MSDGSDDDEPILNMQTQAVVADEQSDEEMLAAETQAAHDGEHEIKLFSVNSRMVVAGYRLVLWRFVPSLF